MSRPTRSTPCDSRRSSPRSSRRTRPNSSSAPLLDAAKALWRGPPFTGLPDAEPLLIEARRLEDPRLHAAEMQLAAELRSSDPRGVIGRSHAMVSEHPLRDVLVSSDESEGWYPRAGQHVSLPLVEDELGSRACELAGRSLTPEEWKTFVSGDGDYDPFC